MQFNHDEMILTSILNVKTRIFFFSNS